jgi:hypothetical protein
MNESLWADCKSPMPANRIRSALFRFGLAGAFIGAMFGALRSHNEHGWRGLLSRPVLIYSVIMSVCVVAWLIAFFWASRRRPITNIACFVIFYMTIFLIKINKPPCLLALLLSVLSGIMTGRLTRLHIVSLLSRTMDSETLDETILGAARDTARPPPGETLTRSHGGVSTVELAR